MNRIWYYGCTVSCCAGTVLEQCWYCTVTSLVTVLVLCWSYAGAALVPQWFCKALPSYCNGTASALCWNYATVQVSHWYYTGTDAGTALAPNWFCANAVVVVQLPIRHLYYADAVLVMVRSWCCTATALVSCWQDTRSTLVLH